jgi:hypothetical protein
MTHLSVLSPLHPYPPQSGGALHILRATQQLARFYRVHLYTLAADPAAVRWGPLAECCEGVLAFLTQVRRAQPVALRAERAARLRSGDRAEPDRRRRATALGAQASGGLPALWRRPGHLASLLRLAGRGPGAVCRQLPAPAERRGRAVAGARGPAPGWC